MIEDIISLLVVTQKIPHDFREIRSCANHLSGSFGADGSTLHFKKSFVADDLGSLVNLVVEPEDTYFEKLLWLELEIQETWYAFNGIHHFQLGQLMMYREAAVFRFVRTLYRGNAVTGSIYILGDGYDNIIARDEIVKASLPSWVNSQTWGRYSGASPGISANIPAYTLSEEEVAAWPDAE
ncbi:hypothetical protein UNDYM_1913 [Undibacterium sp. YM2]|uniref:hypothetical protein n=1 Tax=Undibacterium sp. YM2 TaxID=2058625 RepID=UPI001331F48F|nr:hypothetical protein [Undibacterium sp. YM2]BBB66166.1 hypothetical protein UNDYM_1913 [Undibacterium sp. YM2]